MRIGWRRPAIGLSSGLFQSPSYLLPQLTAAIALSLEVPEARLDWAGSLGYAFPVVVGLLLAAGDWVGGRALILWLAAATLTGVGLIAAGGLLAAAGGRGWEVLAIQGGAALVPVAVRHGALVTGHETRGLDGDAQLREARALRRYLVLGIYLIPLPAGWIADRFGWLWVVGPLAVLQLAALIVLARTVRPSDRGHRRPLLSSLGACAGALSDHWLLWAAAAAFMTQAMVFSCVSGMPIVLAARGFSLGWSGAALTAAVLAALFVDRPRAMSSARFGRLAGVVPASGLLLVAMAASATQPGGSTGTLRGTLAAALFLGAFAVASVAIELGKQWGQALGPIQARAGAGESADYPRRAIVELGANLGAVAGALAGRRAAAEGEGRWLVLSLGLAITAWVLGAAWFRFFPRPWRLGGMRWCFRGREYLLVVGPRTLGTGRGAIFEAPKAGGDEIPLDRQHVAFDPVAISLEAAFARLRPSPRRTTARLARALHRRRD